MTISLQCACGKRYRVGDEAAGKKLKCKACGDVLPVPSPGDEDELAFVDDDPDEEQAPPRALPRRRSTTRSAESQSRPKKPRKRPARRDDEAGASSVLKKVGGVLAMLVGGLMVMGILVSLAQGNPEGHRLGPNAVAASVVMGVGFRWLRQ